jgi:hypothetical protein
MPPDGRRAGAGSGRRTNSWCAGYPASAVGVPGDGWSNLDPPSLFTLALAAAQIGGFLTLRPWLARVLRRPAVRAPVDRLNRHAMTLYCWHQTALLAVTFAGMPAGPVPGLLDPPDASWPAHRLRWLPLFAAVLYGLVAAFQRFEARPSRRAGSLNLAGTGERPSSGVSTATPVQAVSGSAVTPVSPVR